MSSMDTGGEDGLFNGWTAPGPSRAGGDPPVQGRRAPWEELLALDEVLGRTGAGADARLATRRPSPYTADIGGGVRHLPRPRRCPARQP